MISFLRHMSWAQYVLLLWIWAACAFGILDLLASQYKAVAAQAGSMAFSSVAWCCNEHWRNDARRR